MKCLASRSLEIKKIDSDQRIISGIATTPDVDRVGDIVDPMGAKFAEEIPLLWQHHHDKPVGIAEFGRPTKKGIPFTARVVEIVEPGPLKDLVDMAWQSIKAKLVRSVSIGFRALKYDVMSEGGINFRETEIYELSLVTVPANASAKIEVVKILDPGHCTSGPVRLIKHASPKENLNGAVRLIRS